MDLVVAVSVGLVAGALRLWVYGRDGAMERRRLYVSTAVLAAAVMVALVVAR